MDKNSYALGMSIAHNMVSSGIKEVSFDDFMAGLKAVLAGETIAVLYASEKELLSPAAEKFLSACTVQRERPNEEPLIYELVR